MRGQPRLMLALVRGSEDSSKDLEEAAAAVCLLQQVAIEEHLLVMRNRGMSNRGKSMSSRYDENEG